MYKIDFTASAREDLKSLRKFEQKQVLDGIDTQLRYEPTVETRNRKQLDPNEIAEWELRKGSMKTIAVPSHARTLNELFKKARRRSLILESAIGERFVLAPIHNWEAFDVGDSDDFAVEVKHTARNKKLIKLMAERKKNDNGKRYSLEEIKQEFGLQ